jgi:hypothetical protein
MNGMNIQHNSTTAQHTKMIKMREKVTATMVRAAAAWWTTICPPLAGDWLTAKTSFVLFAQTMPFLAVDKIQIISI